MENKGFSFTCEGTIEQPNGKKNDLRRLLFQKDRVPRKIKKYFKKHSGSFWKLNHDIAKGKVEVRAEDRNGKSVILGRNARLNWK